MDLPSLSTDLSGFGPTRKFLFWLKLSNVDSVVIESRNTLLFMFGIIVEVSGLMF